MKWLKLIFLVFLLSACTHRHDGGYLLMPEEYLGYWPPRSRTAGISALDIRPDGMIEINVHPNRYEPVSREYYKIFGIENDGIYMIVKEEDLYDSGLINPRWEYYHYRIEEDGGPHSEILLISWRHCDDLDKDWDLPAHIHWNRVKDEKNTDCPRNEDGTFFHSLVTYSRDVVD